MTRYLWCAVAALTAAVVAEAVWVRWRLDETMLNQLQHDHRLRRVEAPHDALPHHVEIPGEPT